MAGDLNLCQFIGRLGSDPEERYMPSGDPVSNFSIAVGEKWRDKQSGQTKEKTTWIRVVSFGRLAEICTQYLHKGKQVYVSGKWQEREWQDREGNNRKTVELFLQDMQMLGGGQQQEYGQQQSQGQNPPTQGGQQIPTHQPQQANMQPPVDDFGQDDIPF